jgi:hypothetical protein
MSDTDNKIRLCIDALTADVGDTIAKVRNISVTEALAQFMETKTYDLLFDEKSLLYLESAGYIYDLWKDELSSNWQRWTEE